MVVIRKTPVAPPMPTSRTPSSQALPRAVKSKASTANSTASKVPTNGISHEDEPLLEPANNSPKSTRGSSPSTNSKAKGKLKKAAKKKHGKRYSSFTELLTKVLLLFFTIYTLSVCPTDEFLEKPICRGLHAYRRIILEPYVIPPFQAGLAHPSVAPYVTAIKPHYERVVAIATPIVIRTHAVWNARVVPQWNKRIVPQWNKRIAPQWNKRIVPQWNKYAAPQISRLEQAVHPYRLSIERVYEQHIARHIRVARFKLMIWSAQAQPYVIMAAHKTNDAYHGAKPYAVPVLRQVQILLERFLAVLQAYRRQFVDPHVARIWEKVVELSSGKPKAFPTVTPVSTLISTATTHSETVESVVDSTPSSSATPVIPLPTVTDGPAQSAASVIHESLVAPVSAEKMASTVESSPDVTESVVISASIIASAVLESTSSTVLNEESSRSGTFEPIETLQSVSSVLLASVHETAEAASSSFSPIFEQIVSSTASVKEHISSVPIPAAEEEDEGSDIDLDEFYAKIGLEDSESEPELEVPVPPVLVPEAETAEQTEERLRKKRMVTEKKRADITARHAKWEEEVETAKKEQRKALRKAVVATRKAAVLELKDNVEIRAQMQSLAADTENYLRGAEVYLRNLKKDTKKNEDKIMAWNKVLGKIGNKFEEKMHEIENVVQDWYAGVVNKEVQEVHNAYNVVRDIADRAQANLGMDYAWLDDVTYMDWQRYHDLTKNAENFKSQLLTIQNGSHPSPPVNPVAEALDDLSSEIDDIVSGFEERLQRIRRNGERSFIVQSDRDSSENETPAQPLVSILPIQDEKANDAKKAEITRGILGRSAEEVLDALGKVESPGTTSVDLKASQAEGKGLQEEDYEASSGPVTIQTDHEEL